MEYRPEIDGLRALAVIPVIFFHAGFSSFSGGFVGVDVFFVISGYLITTIILSEMEQGSFSLINFYERRARRILPALYLVMLVSVPFAWFWMMPTDAEDFSQSLVAASTFSSNILFWRESGYWDAGNELKPLLHTWSLSVEEQYYVLFPLFLMLMWRFGKHWILGSFLFVAGLSLVAAQWGAHHTPVATFYLLPTRAWELAIGAGIAFYFLYRKKTIRALISCKLADETLGAIGLSLILYAVYAFNEEVPFPSFYALVPTIGAGLIIVFASSHTIVGRLLGSKPLVAVGLISYSAYLWHQPLFAFANHRALVEPNKTVYAALAILVFPLAYLSWRYVEKPFRAKDIFDRKKIFVLSLTGSLFFIMIGLVGDYTNGFGDRTAGNGILAREVTHKLERNYGLSGACSRKFTVSPDCRTNDDPEILVWGDSFAMHLVQGILAANPDAKLIQMTKSVCGPFFDVAPVNENLNTADPWGESCLRFTASVREWVENNDSLKYAVLSSPFRQYLSSGWKLLSRSGEIVDTEVELVIKEFVKTLRELKQLGVTPVVFSPPPENGLDIGRCLAKSEWFGSGLEECNFEKIEFTQEYKLVRQFLEQINREYAVVFLEDLICDEVECSVYVGNTFIFRDKEHLSHEGSAFLGKKFDFHSMIVRD